MEQVSTRVFRSGDGVAVELPEALGFPVGTEVLISRHGGLVTMEAKPQRPKITPAELVRRMRELGPPLTPEVREPIEFPERPGL